MKHLLLLWIWIVSWNQYELRLAEKDVVTGKDGLTIVSYEDFHTVETTTHTIRLKTKEDVDKFVGYDGPCKDNPPLQKIPGTNAVPMQSALLQRWCTSDGIIPDGAFNVKVEKEK